MSETKAEYVVTDKPADFVVTTCEYVATATESGVYRLISKTGCDVYIYRPIGRYFIDWVFCPYCGKRNVVTP